MHTPILYRVYYLKFQYNRIILYKTFDYVEIRLTYEVQGSMLCDKKQSHVQWRDFKMNVLVCDDNRQVVDSVIESLKHQIEETNTASKFYGFSQPSQVNLSLPYDIALLDIDMGEINGIDLPESCEQKMEIL